MNYKSWGFLQKLFIDYYKLPIAKGLFNYNSDSETFNSIKDLMFDKVLKASSPEDARYAYMELFNNFLKSMQNQVIIIDGIEYFDDTTMQTLDLYFDKFKRVNVNFVFITKPNMPLHKKIKSL